MKGCTWTEARSVVQHVFAEIRAEKDQQRDHMADERTRSCRCFSEPCAKNMVYIKISPFRTIHTHAELLNVNMQRKPSLALNHSKAETPRPSVARQQETGFTATVVTCWHPPDKTNLYFRAAMLSPLPAWWEEMSLNALFVKSGGDFLKPAPCQLIWGNAIYNHCFQDNRKMSADFFAPVLRSESVCLCLFSIQSNFHNAEIVGGADMVIQDWTVWIRPGLSGQHSGSR